MLAKRSDAGTAWVGPFLREAHPIRAQKQACRRRPRPKELPRDAVSQEQQQRGWQVNRVQTLHARDRRLHPSARSLQSARQSCYTL
jgi:hypothetical protein